MNIQSNNGWDPLKEVIVGALLDECPIVKRFSKVASISNSRNFAHNIH